MSIFHLTLLVQSQRESAESVRVKYSEQQSPIAKPPPTQAPWTPKSQYSTPSVPLSHAISRVLFRPSLGDELEVYSGYVIVPVGRPW